MEEATHNFAQTQKLENSQNIKKKKKPILKKNVKIVDSIQLNQINLINDLRTQEIPNLFIPRTCIFEEKAMYHMSKDRIYSTNVNHVKLITVG